MQKSLLIGVSVAVVSTLIAATVGSVAGYFGGWRDRALMWFVDLLLVVPSFILIAIVSPAPELGEHRAADRAVVRLQLDDQLAHGARSDDEPAGTRIRSSRAVHGRSELADHRAPHRAERGVDSDHRHRTQRRAAILAETGLSFLGFGVQPPDVSLGTLIADGTKSATTFPWVFLFPAGVLVLILVCANLTGDGLRDALDPGSPNLRASGDRCAAGGP